MERIFKYLSAIGIDCPDSAINKFTLYYNELTEWNKRFNLTAITDYDEVVIKHFIDSISAVKYIPKNATIIDIGSGAGFPAIPIKIVREDVKVTMIDSLNKRVNFLNHMINVLELNDTSAEHSRAEDYIKGRRESFDIATARAVAPLNTLYEICLPYVRVGGCFIAYKTSDIEEFNNSARALNELQGKLLERVEFTLPYSDIKRALIIVKKQSNSPAIYPRSPNVIKKKPL